MQLDASYDTAAALTVILLALSFDVAGPLSVYIYSFHNFNFSFQVAFSKIYSTPQDKQERECRHTGMQNTQTCPVQGRDTDTSTGAYADELCQPQDSL